LKSNKVLKVTISIRLTKINILEGTESIHNIKERHREEDKVVIIIK
jgi:hypothetical protein